MPPGPYGKDKEARVLIPQKHDFGEENMCTGLLPRKHIGPSLLRRHPPGNRGAFDIAGSSREMLENHSAKENAGTGSSGGVSLMHCVKKTAAGVCLSGGRLQKQVYKQEKVGAGLMPLKHCPKGNMRPSQHQDHLLGIQGAVNMTETHTSKHTKSNTPFPTNRTTQHLRSTTSSCCFNASTSSCLDAHHGSTSTQRCKESTANEIARVKKNKNVRRELPGVQGAVNLKETRIAREKHLESKTLFPIKRTSQYLRTASSTRCFSASSGRPLDILHGNSSTQGCKESATNKIVHVTENKIVQEVNDAVQRLNDMGWGEDISYEEFCEYRLQLPPDPTCDGTNTKLRDEERYRQNFCHAEYRIRSYKLSPKVSKTELQDADLKKNFPVDLFDKEEFSPDFLEENNFFKHFEREDILDWFFHPDLCSLADLNDYQRLVPRNHGNCEYTYWDEYHRHFHSYEMQQEYIEYFEKLLRELQWLENCLPIKLSSPVGERISRRGIYQAIKIATKFSKITLKLSYIGFYECLRYIGFDAAWYKEYDDVYFEILQRVGKQKKSFRDALDEVYKLNKFPLRQERMKYSLKCNCSSVEEEFLACTAGITSEVSDDEAKLLIAEKVKQLRKKPKFYNQYIRTKIDIARAIEMI